MIKQIALSAFFIFAAPPLGKLFAAQSTPVYEGSAALNKWLGVNTRRVRWCGIYLSKVIAHAPRNAASVDAWRHWGHAVNPRNVKGKQVIVIFKHRHVGKLVSIKGNCILVTSGNDGNAVRTRCRKQNSIRQYRSR